MKKLIYFFIILAYLLISPSLYSQNYLDINVQPTNGANIVISSGESINVAYTYYNGASPLGFIMIPNFSFNIKFEIYDVSTPLTPIYSSQSFSASWSAPGVSPWTGSSGATFTIPCSVNLSNTATYEVIAKVTNIWMEDGDPGPGSFTASVGNIFFGQGCSNYSTTNYPWQDCTFKIANATTSGSLNIALTTTDVTCTGINVNGTASATITGGVAPIHTFWTIGQQSLTSLQSGSYTVTSTDANGCQVTQPFTINQDPSIYFVPYQTSITGNVTWNQSLINVDGEVRIEDGATLTIANGTKVEFSHHADPMDAMPTGVARLIVRGNLIVEDNAILTGCSGGKWDGIEVWGTGIFNTGQGTATIGAATIENADIGITSHGRGKINQGILNNRGGQITTIGTTFNNNRIGMNITQNYNNVPYLVSNCDFIYNGNSLYNYTYQYEDQPTHIIAGATNITATANNFYGGANDFPAAERGYGISCFDCEININNPVAGTQQFNGLTRAINANYISSANMISVNNVNINNCQEGIYLQGADLAEINNSTFNIATADAQDTYGVFLVGSGGTEVTGNSFIGSGVSSTFDSYGLVAENTGSGGALIFDNTFEATDFGLQTQANNPTFKIRCNNFAANGNSHNQYAWATLPKGATNTLMQQGTSCSTTPFPNVNENQAGNEWLNNCGSGSSDVFVDNSISFGYKAHEFNSSGLATTRPFCSTPAWYSANVQECTGVNKTPTSCNSPFAGITVNPDVDFDGYVTEVKTLIGVYQNEVTALTNLIDGGNTLSLLSAINTQSVGNVKNTLLNASPYLSDEVLLAYLNKTPPAGHIKQVVEQNSPVTTVVAQKLDNMNLPTGIRNQINALQTGVSERQKLENQILSIEGEIQLLINDLRRKFRNRLEKPKEKQLLEEITRLESDKSLAKIYLDENNTVNSRAKLNQLAQHNTLENTKFCTLMNCLVTAKEQNRTVEQLTVSELQTVETVAVSETKVANNAQGITNKNPNQFIEHPIVKIANGNNLRLASKPEEETSNSLDSYRGQALNFNLYPNPSNGLLTIQPLEKTEENYVVECFNAHGQLVIAQKLTSDAISLNNFGNGIYLVRLLNSNGVAVYSGRIILQK